MTTTQARSILTNQTGVHEELLSVIAKHKYSEFRRPVAEHTLLAFKKMIAWLADWHGDVIIDACCGVGESTLNIANQYPRAKVVGVDKSLARLDKHRSYVAKNESVNGLQRKPNNEPNKGNYLLLQADLNDFWRLLHIYIVEQTPNWRIVKQFILYPNPYPKKSQLGKRWHGSALFPTIIRLSSNIEVRSNWRLYLEEFLEGAKSYGLTGSIELIQSSYRNVAYTPFERKYLAADQACFKLVIRP